MHAHLLVIKTLCKINYTTFKFNPVDLTYLFHIFGISCRKRTKNHTLVLHVLLAHFYEYLIMHASSQYLHTILGCGWGVNDIALNDPSTNQHDHGKEQREPYTDTRL